MRFVSMLLVALIFVSCQNTSQTDAAEETDLPASAFTATDSYADEGLSEEDLMESVSIDVDRAGIVTIGMSVMEVYQWFDSTQIRKAAATQTASPSTYAIYLPESAPMLLFTVSASDTITGITIQNPTYQTEKGIGVGSTFSQLGQAYHIAKVFTTHNRQVIATVEELQKKQLLDGKEEVMIVQFELGVDASSIASENNTVLPGSIPPDTKITRIFL